MFPKYIWKFVGFYLEEEHSFLRVMSEQKRKVSRRFRYLYKWIEEDTEIQHIPFIICPVNSWKWETEVP